ncbi:hypothetical protein N2152v2_001503 [Parachlorella kessleri]
MVPVKAGRGRNGNLGSRIGFAVTRAAAEGSDEASLGKEGTASQAFWKRPLAAPLGTKIVRAQRKEGGWHLETAPCREVESLGVEMEHRVSTGKQLMGPLKILLPCRGPQKEVLLIGPDHWSYKAPWKTDLTGSVWDLVRAAVMVKGHGVETVGLEGAQETQLVVKYANFEGYRSFVLGEALDPPLSHEEQLDLEQLITGHIRELQSRHISWIERNAAIQRYKESKGGQAGRGPGFGGGGGGAATWGSTGPGSIALTRTSKRRPQAGALRSTAVSSAASAKP